jgi:magnesium chelatase subunit D
MSDKSPSKAGIWRDAWAAAELLAVDPHGLGGVWLKAPAGLARDAWLARLRLLIGAEAPMAKIPCDVADSQLLGGLDLAATLAAGRPSAQVGVLARAHGGLLVAAMAERLTPTAAAHVAAALDAGAVTAERDGLSLHAPARFGVVALDEAATPDERPPQVLLERLGLMLDLSQISHRDCAPPSMARTPDEIAAARAHLRLVSVPGHVIEALCAASTALGVASLRAPVFAVKAVRAAAALAGRRVASDEDAALAARLVIACRATQLPAIEDETVEEQPPEPPQDQPDPSEPSASQEVRQLQDVVLEAALASLPPGLLAQLGELRRSRGQSSGAGKAGDRQATLKRGRPLGARRGDPRAGARLDLLQTLRAAAPWQGLRRRPEAGSAVAVRKDDFHLRRFKDKRQSTTIFVVDASGSTAIDRLAEAKGAVELLLSDCYVRRDEVALIAFRGTGADLLLPPTRSLHRAKRELSAMPGGGGTPLAAGILAAGHLAEDVKRKGRTPTLVIITDGRANVTRDGQGGRAEAQAEANAAAKSVRAQKVRTLLVDASNRPEAKASQLAGEMGATYLPLPRANAAMLLGAVKATHHEARAAR